MLLACSAQVDRVDWDDLECEEDQRLLAPAKACEASFPDHKIMYMIPTLQASLTSFGCDALRLTPLCRDPRKACSMNLSGSGGWSQSAAHPACNSTRLRRDAQNTSQGARCASSYHHGKDHSGNHSTTLMSYSRSSTSQLLHAKLVHHHTYPLLTC